MKYSPPAPDKVFGKTDLQALVECKLKQETIESLAVLCYGQRFKMKKRTTKKKEKQPTHTERAALFGKVSTHASELLRLFNGEMLIEDHGALHDEVERLDDEDGGSIQFDPRSWGGALSALRMWSEAARNLQIAHEALKHTGPGQAPAWRREFLSMVAMWICRDGIGIKTKEEGGRFFKIAVVCYQAAEIQEQPGGDIEAFIKQSRRKEVGSITPKSGTV